MSIRMMPISFVFNRFPRVVRDLAGKLGKQAELRTVGEGTELDKGLIEKITDPLTHLVRNSIDHGIESPADRLAAGKPEKGTITLRAFHQGGNVIIEVSDDGRGLDRDKILAKARERGMTVPDTITDAEVWQLIFEAGFSTADQVTDVSGRGVGMDVVKRNIHALGGRVEIDTKPGAGTRIAVRLPLTLAILDGLSVEVGSELFIVPLTYIVESLQPRPNEVKTVSGRGRVVHVRGEYLPLIPLHEVFNLRPRVKEIERGIVVILETEGRKTAILVDELVGQHQVVIKSLETNYRRVYGVSGATIMGDGKVALILDVAGVAARGGVAGAKAAAAIRNLPSTSRTKDGHHDTRSGTGCSEGRPRRTGRGTRQRVPHLHPRSRGVRHRDPQGAGNPRLRCRDQNRQHARIHQGRDQPARHHRPHRRPQAAFQPRRRRI